MDTKALQGLSFDAPNGMVTALLGPNGAGKTTTLDVLSGFIRPDSGTVRILGMDPQKDAAKLRRLVGVMPQQPGVHTGLRPLEALELHAAFHEKPLNPGELLEEVGLTHRSTTSFKKLSGGEQQRLSLALSLVGSPRLLFLDEPTAGVDPEGRNAIRGLIGKLRDEGVSVVVTTHDLDEAQHLADNVVIIDHGQVVAAGTPDELMRSSPKGKIRFDAPAGIDVITLSSAVGADVREVRRGEYEVDGESTPSLVAAVATWMAEHDLSVGDIRAGRQRLEDVFLQLTGERSDAAGQRVSPRRSGSVELAGGEDDDDIGVSP